MRRALQLLRESNPTLLDCLRSSHVLCANHRFLSAATTLARSHLSMRTVTNQLLTYASKHLSLYIANATPRTVIVKKYFYVLHPLLTLRLMRVEKAKELPSLDFRTLIILNSPTLDELIRAALHTLLELKLTSQLSHENAASLFPILDQWIATEMQFAESFTHSFSSHSSYLRSPTEPFDLLLQAAVMSEEGDESVVRAFELFEKEEQKEK